MLKILIPDDELWNNQTQRFEYVKEQTVVLEHSLVSISKWESKWHKPFLTEKDKTNEETLYYLQCMMLTQNVKDEVYHYLMSHKLKEIKSYIDDPMTATWFGEEEKKPSGRKRIVTSELIYCWMVQLQIPVEFQKWHINRLITLIKVINEESKQKKDLPMKDVYRRNAALNKARSKGRR